MPEIRITKDSLTPKPVVVRKKVHYINVGNMPPKEVQEYLEQIKKEFAKQLVN